MRFEREDKVFYGELELRKRQIHEKYRERIARADFLEAIELTCQMNAEIDAAIDELLRNAVSQNRN